MRTLNIAMIVRTLCMLLLFEAAFMLVPIIVALSNHETGALQAFAISFCVTLCAGLGGYLFIKPSRSELNKYDSVLLTSLVWVIFSLFGLLPYMLAPTTQLSFSAAFYEAMSGFTTTGASLIETTDELSKAIHIWRCLSQWIGGLGIIIITLALIPMFNSSGGMQMFNAEQNKISQEKVSPRISNTARRLWAVYILLTIALFGLLCIGPMTVFESACHAFTTMATGGLSTSSQGINQFSTVYVKVIITLFMFLGGVNFAMVYRASTGQFRSVVSNEPFKMYCKIIGLTTIAFIVCIVAENAVSDWQSVTIDPLFQVVSFITSTGYILSDYSNWGPAVIIISLMLIFMGGCAGSTSGGAKVDRLIYMGKFLHNEIRKAMRPNSVWALRINNKVATVGTINRVIAFLLFYVLIIIVGAFLLCITGFSIDNAFMSALAAMANSCLSITTPTISGDYAMMGASAHYILSALMLIGRLEIMTVLVLFSRSFWRG